MYLVPVPGRGQWTYISSHFLDSIRAQRGFRFSRWTPVSVVLFKPGPRGTTPTHPGPSPTLSPVTPRGEGLGTRETTERVLFPVRSRSARGKPLRESGPTPTGVGPRVEHDDPQYLLQPGQPQTNVLHLELVEGVRVLVLQHRLDTCRASQTQSVVV